MSDKSKRRYEPPTLTDLSGHNASGWTEGICKPGGAPATSACRDGSTPYEPGAGNCSPVGNSPWYAACNAGTNVYNFCNTGSHVSPLPTRCSPGTTPTT
jgi:hypothetical protein